MCILHLSALKTARAKVRDLRASLRAAEKEAAELAKEKYDLEKCFIPEARRGRGDTGATRGQACPQPPRYDVNQMRAKYMLAVPELWYDPTGMTEVPVCQHPTRSFNETCGSCELHIQLMEMKRQGLMSPGGGVAGHAAARVACMAT